MHDRHGPVVVDLNRKDFGRAQPRETPLGDLTGLPVVEDFVRSLAALCGAAVVAEGERDVAVATVQVVLRGVLLVTMGAHAFDERTNRVLSVSLGVLVRTFYFLDQLPP